MGHSKLTVNNDWKTKRDQLSRKRDSLFKTYSRNPDDLSLALEIKTIDDEIAEYTAKLREETLLERKSKAVNPHQN